MRSECRTTNGHGVVLARRTHLRMLVEKIYVHEEDGKLSLNICLKAPFRDHIDVYENGEQTECWLSQDYDFQRLGPIIMRDFYENG